MRFFVYVKKYLDELFEFNVFLQYIQSMMRPTEKVRVDNERIENNFGFIIIHTYSHQPCFRHFSK